MAIRVLLLGGIMAGISYGALGQQVAGEAQQLANLVKRDSITILVTDSGLGGLSVCAALDSLARSTGRYARLRVIFANALPESGSGYNRMSSMDEKARVFNDALEGMVNAYAPDAVLIACNTLSVVYPHTRFSASTAIPVIGIVAMGVEMIEEELRSHPAASVIVFGTETTIGAGTHKRLLVERGVPADRIVLQACPDLAGKIERDARGPDVRDAIAGFVSDAVGADADAGGRVVGALCCTHYGYAVELFRSALADRTAGEVTMLDPNLRMARLVFPADRKPAHPSPDVTVQVVSRAVITPEEMQSIGALLQPVSAPTAAALWTYELRRDLFPYHAE